MKVVVYKDPKSLKQRKLKKRKKQHKIDIYVVRINSLGELLNSKPCAECVNAMKYAGINRVFYSTSKNEIVCEKVKYMYSDHLSHHQETTLCINQPVWKF